MDDRQPGGKLVASRSVVKAAAHVEPHHPDWLVDHALAAGWLWALFWVLLLLPADHFRWHSFLWIAIVVIAVLPSFGATVVVLSQTPHSHLRRSESVLGHFFSRFAAYAFGFIVWTLSIVLSSAISVQLESEAKNSALHMVGLGVSLFVEVVPVAILFLWLMLVVRYAWFLSRLRGWQARPRRTRIPQSFLADSPRTSRLLVGLAHPGLLAATGAFTVLIGLLLYVDDVTIHIV